MTSYLGGDEWTLRTRVLKRDTHDIILTHDAAIRASNETRKKWNAQFWALFPVEPDLFRAAVIRGDINVSILLQFRPTVRLKENYGGLPVLKIQRIAEGGKKPLPSVAAAVDQYERDKARLEEQRRQAWVELTALRLPSPPYGYQWELLNGDPRAFSDLLNFRLKLR